MKNQVVLPKWLDDYIFNTLSAKFCKQCKDLVVLNWDANDILCYLGTYFPRSYAESYCIFSQYLLNNKNELSNNEEVSIFDFGCGTAGELIGLLIALNERRSNIKQVHIQALDGNHHALRNLEQILTEVQKYVHFLVDYQVIPFVIDDFYDLSLVESVCLKDTQYDIVISFKAICEFVTKQQLEERNPYEYLLQTFSSHISAKGLICLADITSYSDVAHDWLPKIIDQGINASSMTTKDKNENYNEIYYITHSHKQNDTSKIAWRILTPHVS